MKTIGDSIDTYRIVWKQDEPGSWEGYLVENVSEPGSLYCLQVQPKSRFTRQEEYSAFRAQMEALQKVRELYIHRLIGFGADGDGHPYLVYPEVTVGLKSLQSRLQEGPLGEEEAKGILTRVGMALVFAHQQGVVHGFFSPESVLLMGDGDVRVFSFLSSVPDTSLARVSLPRGYRFLDEKASRLSDQYALASLANELLLQPGRLPTNATVLHQAISRAQLSDPARRFATIREFLLQLGIELTLPQSEQEREAPTARPEEKTRFDYAMEALQARGRSDIVGIVEEPTLTTNPPPATKSTSAGTMASAPPQTRTGNASQAAKRPANRRGCLITLLCILLIPLLIFLHSILPASAATVTIAPVDQQLHQNYQLKEAAATNLAAQQFGGHTLTYKTKTTTKSSHISKKTFVEGTSAQGHLVFSQISDPIYLDLYDLSIDVGNNVTLIVDDKTTTMRPGHSYTVPVHATKNGVQGNLPAGYVDDTYTLSFSETAFISNPKPLTGGQDDYNGPVVAADEVNAVENGLRSAQQQEAQKAFQAQLKSGEALLSDFSCAQTNKVQPGVDSHVADFKVTSYATCAVGVYNQVELNAALTDAMHKLALQKFDSHFALKQPVKVTITDAGVARADGSPITVALSVDSVWRLLLDAKGKQAMQQALAGLSQDDALALLSNRYKSRSSALSLSWFWGGHMPADASSIQITAHYLFS